MPTDFDQMDEVQDSLLWLSFTSDGYTVEENDEVIAEETGPVTGVITSIKENVGANDSRLYQIKTEAFDRNVAFWGKASIDNQVDDAGIQVGHEIGIRPTGETGESSNGTFDIFEVRYSK